MRHYIRSHRCFFGWVKRDGFYRLFFCQGVVLFGDVEHIGEHGFFFMRVAKEQGGVVNGGDHIIALLNPLAVLGGNLIIGANQTHGGDSAKANDQLGLNKAHLLTQVIDANVLLCAEGIAVFGWTAFEHIGDIYLVARDTDGIEILIKQFARTPHKGCAGKILLFAGCFPDEHQIGIFVACTENGIGFGFVKGAFLAVITLFFKFIPSHIVSPFF